MSSWAEELGPFMSTVRLKCSCGHSWEYPVGEPVPADLRTICPACLSADDVPAPVLEPLPNAAPKHAVPGFEVMEEINRGGMGVIFKARQIAMNRLVALKAINPSKLEQPGARDRFDAEVKASALLNHANIVTVFQADLDGPFPYVAMEYVPGIDLLRLVRKVGPLPVTDAVYYIRQAAEGLQHAFEQGLIHRDIKPSNLMVSPGPIGSAAVRAGKLPKVKILDMGLARVVTPEGTDAEPGLTQAGVFLGTPDYVSPEQAEDSQQADTRSDIFSLGGALYFLLTAEVPFPGRTLVEKVRKAISGPPSVLAKRKDVPPSLDGVVRKMLAPTPPTATRRRPTWSPRSTASCVAKTCPAYPKPRRSPRRRWRWAKSRRTMARSAAWPSITMANSSSRRGKIAGCGSGRR